MRKLIALLLAGLMVVAFAGCSKDKKDNVEASTATTQPASSSQDDEEAAEPEESESASGDCPSQDEVDEINATLEEATTGSAPDFDALSDAYDQIGEFVPSELEGDFDTVRAAMDDLMSAIEGVDLNDPNAMDTMTPEQQAAITEATMAMESAEFTEASDNIEAYFADACPDINFG